MINEVLGQLPLDKINAIAVEFTQFTKTNPVIGGVIGVWALGVITFALKFIPNTVYSFLKKQLTVTLSVHNQDELFVHLIKWYEKNGWGTKSRTLRAQNGGYGYGEVTVSAGYGNHYFWRGLRPFKMSRMQTTSQSTFGTSVKESIEIVTIGRSQKIIRDLISEVIKVQTLSNTTKVYRWSNDQWMYSHSQPSRTLNSVFLSSEIRKKILETVTSFEKDKKFYVENGIPYHLGLLFHGPPGTGKTSMVKAMCGHLNRHLYVLNMRYMTDRSLETALSLAGEEAIVLMEDVDACGVSVSRPRVARQQQNGKQPEGQPQVVGQTKHDQNYQDDDRNMFLSLSGILNAIDGVTSGDGRVLIMTTNYPDSLDPALMRKGRVDLSIELGYLTKDTFLAMMNKLYPGHVLPRSVNLKENVTPAYVQGLVLENRNDPNAVLSLVCEPQSDTFSLSQGVSK